MKENFYREYLLGGLSPEEKERVEASLLTDEDAFEELSLAEEGLVDGYLHGELPEPDRARFTQHYLSTPAGRENLLVAQAFVRYVDSVPDAGRTAAETLSPGGVSRWRAFLNHLRFPKMLIALPVTAVLLLAALGLYLTLFRFNRPAAEEAAATPTPPRQQQDGAPVSPNVEKPEEHARGPLGAGVDRPDEVNRGPGKRAATPPGQRRGSPSSLAVTLIPGIVRGGGVSAITLPRDIDRLNLKLGLTDDEYPRYRAVLHSEGGARLLTKNGLKVSGARGTPSVDFAVPAKLLGNGSYSVTLSGVAPGGELEDLGQYYFQVKKN